VFECDVGELNGLLLKERYAKRVKELGPLPRYFDFESIAAVRVLDFRCTESDRKILEIFFI
jgi:hypothetical protein